MKKLLLVLCLLNSFNLFAQFSTNWVNHFCCFDSIAPHSYSYSCGVEVMNDSICVGYWQDGNLRVKTINSVTGADLGNVHFAADTIAAPFYFGGSFKKTSNGYVFVVKNEVQTGQPSIIVNFLDPNFNSISKTFFSSATSNVPLSPLMKLSAADEFVFATVTDSLRLYKIDATSNTTQISAFENSSLGRFENLIYQQANGNVLLFNEVPNGATSYFPRVLVFNPGLDSIVQILDLLTDLSGDHQYTISSDTLTIAYEEPVTNEILLRQVDLNSLSVSQTHNSGLTDFYSLDRLVCDSINGDYYLLLNARFIKFDRQLNVLFDRTLVGESFPAYNQHEILFDSNANPILAYSWLDNSISNEDLIVYHLNKIDGSTIDSVTYSDIRNTADLLQSLFIDSNNNLNLLYANDYDNLFILQEETQLNVIQFSNNLLGQTSLSQLNNLLISPNPTHGRFNLHLGKEKEGKLIVSDLLAKIKKQFDVNSSNQEIDINDLNSGMYLIQFIGKTKTYTQKILKL